MRRPEAAVSVERLRAAPPRSWLFVPALRAVEWIPKALASGADAVIVDLEDATAPAEKDHAREVVRGLRLTAAPPWIFIRVNAEPRERLESDLAAAAASRAAGFVMPKASHPDEVRHAARTFALACEPGREFGVLVMVETARGVLRALELAEADAHVVALGFGGEDLAASLGVTRTRQPGEHATARTLVALAAAAAGVAAVDTPWLDIKDSQGAEREALESRQLGYAGKLCIHPSHVPVVNAAFSPGDDEVSGARRIVEAFERAIADGRGVATLDGRMIDMPVVVAARSVLARAERGR